MSRVLRAAALPGADLFIAGTAALGSTVGAKLARGLAIVGLRPSPDVAEVARGYASLNDAERRAAFLATLRGVVGTGGQRVAAGDRFYLAQGMPTLIIWGARDPIIPVQHARNAHEAIPGSCLEVFPESASAAARGARALHRGTQRFIEEHEPATFNAGEWRARLRSASGEA